MRNSIRYLSFIISGIIFLSISFLITKAHSQTYEDYTTKELAQWINYMSGVKPPTKSELSDINSDWNQMTSKNFSTQIYSNFRKSSQSPTGYMLNLDPIKHQTSSSAFYTLSEHLSYTNAIQTYIIGGGFRVDYNNYGYVSDFQMPSYIINNKSYDNIGNAFNAVNDELEFHLDYLYGLDEISHKAHNRIDDLVSQVNDILSNPPESSKTSNDINQLNSLVEINSDRIEQNHQDIEKKHQESKKYTDQQISKTYDVITQEYTDYVNQQVNQSYDNAVKSANAYTDHKFNELKSDINENRKEARQAASIGLAASSLRFDQIPGKLSIGAGFGTWRGESANAFGLGYTSTSGNIRINSTAVNSGGHWGASIGASFTLN